MAGVRRIWGVGRVNPRHRETESPALRLRSADAAPVWGTAAGVRIGRSRDTRWAPAGRRPAIPRRRAIPRRPAIPLSQSWHGGPWPLEQIVLAGHAEAHRPQRGRADLRLCHLCQGGRAAGNPAQKRWFGDIPPAQARRFPSRAHQASSVPTSAARPCRANTPHDRPLACGPRGPLADANARPAGRPKRRPAARGPRNSHPAAPDPASQAAGAGASPTLPDSCATGQQPDRGGFRLAGGGWGYRYALP